MEAKTKPLEEKNIRRLTRKEWELEGGKLGNPLTNSNNDPMLFLIYA